MQTTRDYWRAEVDQLCWKSVQVSNPRGEFDAALDDFAGTIYSEKYVEAQ
jgi:hypothetical protein